MLDFLFKPTGEPAAGPPERSMDLPLGVEIGTRLVRVAKFRYEHGDVVLERAAQREIVGSGSVQEISSLLGTVLDELQISRTPLRRPMAVLSLPETVSIVRRVVMSEMRGRRRARSVRFKAADTRGFNSWKIDDCETVIKAIDGDPRAFLVTKTLRADLQRYAQILRSAGLRPRIEHRSFALHRALPEAEAILDIGAHGSTLYAFAKDDGKGGVRQVPIALSVRDLSMRLPVGGAAITSAIMRSRNVTEETAEAIKRRDGVAAASDSVDAFSYELQAHIGRLRDEASATIARLTLVGGGARLAGLAEHLTNQLDLTVEVASLPYLESDEPPSVLAARAPDLANLVGCALFGAEAPGVARTNLLGREGFGLSSISIDTQRLRQAALAPIAVIALCMVTYSVEGYRVAQMNTIADVRERGAVNAERLARHVTTLKGNVEQLLALVSELQRIRSSASQRASELVDVGLRIPSEVRIASLTATAYGWRIQGSARTDAELGTAVIALRKAFSNVRVVPLSATRPDNYPNDPITYEVEIHRTGPDLKTVSQAPSPASPGPYVPLLGVIAIGALRPRVPFDRRLLFVTAFAIAGIGYFGIVYYGESLYGDAERRYTLAVQRENQALASLAFERTLDSARADLTKQIRSLTPQRDESTLLGTAWQTLDQIAHRHAHFANGRYVSGVYLQALGGPTTTADKSLDEMRVQAAMHPAGAPTPAPPSNAKADDKVVAPDASLVAPGGLTQRYATSVPIAVVFNGPYEDVIAALRDISRAPVLVNVVSASVRVVKPDILNPIVKVSLVASLFMPVQIGPDGSLVEKTDGKPIRHALRIGTAADAAGAAPTTPAPVVTPAPGAP